MSSKLIKYKNIFIEPEVLKNMSLNRIVSKIRSWKRWNRLKALGGGSYYPKYSGGWKSYGRNRFNYKRSFYKKPYYNKSFYGPYRRYGGYWPYRKNYIY